MSVPTDHELDLSVASMLRFGVTLAAIVVLTGGLLYLRDPWVTIPDFTRFVGGTASTTSLVGIFRGLRHLNPESTIQTGLVILIATPVARVVFCIVGFARQRDRLYVLVSVFVLLVLLYSLAKGAH